MHMIVMIFNYMMEHAVIETGNDTYSVQASTHMAYNNTGVLAQSGQLFDIFHYSMMLA